MAENDDWYNTVMKLEKRVNSVYLVSKELGDSGVQQVAAAVRKRGKINTIILHKCDIGSLLGAEALADTLRTPSVLTKLSVENCNLGDQGLVVLSSTLRTDSVLRELLLNGNSIGVKGANALAGVLPDISTLETLSLNSNHLGDQGVVALAEALASSGTNTLQNLRLSGNSVTDKGAKVVATFLEIDKGLCNLELWNNKITSQGANAIARSLTEHNTTLTSLNLNSNKIGASGVTELCNVLESSHPLAALHLEGNPGRKHRRRPTRVVIGISDVLSTSGRRVRTAAMNLFVGRSETPIDSKNGRTLDVEHKPETISHTDGHSSHESDPLNESTKSIQQVEEPSLKLEYIPPTDPRFDASVNGRTGHCVNDIYEIQSEISHGSFGTVFQALNRRIGNTVAIKVGSPTILDHNDACQGDSPIEDYNTMEHFCQEIKTLLRLRNSGTSLMHMEEFYVETGAFYIVSEPMGCKLSYWRATVGHFSEEMAKEIAKTLLSGIAYMHSMHVIHRDIKLQNILFQEDGNISTLKIIDFGLSRALMSDNEWRKTFVGSIGYVAPEIYNRERYRVEVDMYSFGVVLFRLLSGKRPFESKSKKELQRLVVANKYSMDNDHWKSVTNEAKDFVGGLIIGRGKRFSAEKASLHPWFQAKHSERNAVPPTPQAVNLQPIQNKLVPEERGRSGLDDYDCSVHGVQSALVSIIRSGVLDKEIFARARSDDGGSPLESLLRGAFASNDRVESTSHSDSYGRQIQQEPPGNYQIDRRGNRVHFNDRVQFNDRVREQWLGSVFVSHTGQDDSGAIFASHLCDSFEQEGIKSFLDAEDIHEGDLWEDKLVDGVLNCSVFVCVLTAQYFDRHWCMKELDIAFQCEKVIIPVYLPAEPPEVDDAFSRDFIALHTRKKDMNPQIPVRWLINIRRLKKIQAVRSYSTPKHYQVEMKKKTVNAVKAILRRGVDASV